MAGTGRKMSKRKLMAVILTAVFAISSLSLSACGNNTSQESAAEETAASESTSVKAVSEEITSEESASEDAAAEDITATEPDPAEPELRYSGDFTYTETSENTVSIAGYTGEQTQVVIPNELDGKTVTAIGDEAFFTQSRITSVELPETITEIGAGAFLNCVSLESIVLPDSVESIGKYAFGRDEKLVSVKLSSKLTSIPAYAFYRCSALQALVIPESVMSIGKSAFARCEALASLQMPEHAVSIDGFAFYDCKSLKELKLHVETLAANVLSGTTLTSLEFSADLTRIEDAAFKGVNVTLLSLPASLKEIGTEAFTEATIGGINIDEGNENYIVQDGVLFTKDMSTLVKFPSQLETSSYIVPESVTEIAPHAFERAFMLSQLQLPSQLQKIGNHAFAIASIESIVIPAGVKSIDDYAFYSCGMLSTVVLSEGLEQIGERAFFSCSCLAAIDIPSTVTSIDASAFAAGGIADINVSEGNAVYASVNGILYDKDKKTLLAFPCGKAAEYNCRIEVPEGTEIIGEGAFYMIDGMGELALPSSVKKLESKAVYECKNLKEVEEPATVTDIGELALGFQKDVSSSNDILSENFYILGEEGSAAYDYAVKNEVGFFTEKQSGEAIEITMNTGDVINIAVPGTVAACTVYTSSDEEVAYVDEAGQLKAVSAGKVSVALVSGAWTQFYRVTTEGDPVEDDHESAAQKAAAEYNFNGAEYKEITKDEEAAFSESYKEYNTGVSFDWLDNVNINCYTGDDYSAIFAAEGDEGSIEGLKGGALEDYSMFEPIAEGMYEELTKFSCNENLILYSGTPTVDYITGTGSTVADMKSSIGQIYESVPCTSTSLSHNVAIAYAAKSPGSSSCVMEIYAPAGTINGGYVSMVSKFPSEYEYLMNVGAKFVVLDAGIREVEGIVSAEAAAATGSTIISERYIKLLLLP